MRPVHVSRQLPKYYLSKRCQCCLIAWWWPFLVPSRPSTAFYSVPLQAVYEYAEMSLALCPQVVSQALQHFRCSETRKVQQNSLTEPGRGRTTCGHALCFVLWLNSLAGSLKENKSEDISRPAHWVCVFVLCMPLCQCSFVCGGHSVSFTACFVLINCVPFNFLCVWIVSFRCYLFRRRSKTWWERERRHQLPLVHIIRK